MFADDADDLGIAGVAFARVQEDLSWKAPFAKTFSDESRTAVNDIAGAMPGDVLLFVADKPKKANTCMAAIRLHMGEKLGLTRVGEFKFMWLTDPPLFEYAEAEKKWVSSHHPFTSPRPEDEDKLLSDPEHVLARAYDVVLNGLELGGGSIRIHDRPLQTITFVHHNLRKVLADPTNCKPEAAETRPNPSVSLADLEKLEFEEVVKN